MLSAKVSVIDWRESKNSDLVAFENNQVLDQQNEQYFNEIKITQNQILIVGLGSGFILDFLLKKYPSLEIHVIECRDSLIARQRKRFPQVHFHYFHDFNEFESSQMLNLWLQPKFQKILNKPALGQQTTFFQEMTWFLNLRTTRAIQKIVKFKKPLDDRWLVNLHQFLDSVDTNNLSYPDAHSKILRELVK